MKNIDDCDFYREGKVYKAEPLSDYDLDKVSGGYNENEYNKEGCENKKVWNLRKCTFCTKLVIHRGNQLCDGIMCNTVNYYCQHSRGIASLMCTHWSLPTGETVQIKVYE